MDPVNYNSLIRFAIFQSEGGPVPNGATIQSATLALYKQYYNDTLRLNALLKPWVEAEATWTNRQTGVPWTVGGAAGAGTDYSATTDALVTPSFNPGWVSFDVTLRVRQWASGANFGWRMMQTTSGGNTKVFTASEYTTDTTLRPKLTIVYSGGTSNVPPTVSLTSPTAGAAITLGQSFTLTASASDSDGTVTKVDFYANGTLVGSDTTAPYTVVWTPGAVGSYALTAIATDNKLATTTSAAINVTVNPVASGTTIVLQRGLSGYAGASDTYLDRYLPTTVRGALGTLLVDPVNYNALLPLRDLPVGGWPGAQRRDHPVGHARALQAVLQRHAAVERTAQAVGRGRGHVDQRPCRRAVDRGRCRRRRHRLQHDHRRARHPQLQSRLGQLRRDPPGAAMGERRELRLAHDADDQRR